MTLAEQSQYRYALLWRMTRLRRRLRTLERETGYSDLLRKLLQRGIYATYREGQDIGIDWGLT
jgi:hypothetical protein